MVLGRLHQKGGRGEGCVCVCVWKGQRGVDMWQDAKHKTLAHSFASAMCNVMWVGLVFENRLEMLP